MGERKKHTPGQHERWGAPVAEPTLKAGLTVGELVENFAGSAYNARRLGNAVKIWAEAL